MATDAGVLREFFVGLSYKVDQSSQQQFQKGVAAADKSVAGLQNVASKAGNALTQLGQQFKSVGDEPVRKFADGTRRIADGMMRLTKGTIELGRSAMAVGGAFAAGILQVTKNFQELYYVAQRTGTTVAQLAALRYASEQGGKGVDALTQALEAMNQKIVAGQQGMANFASRFISGGRHWDNFKDKTEASLEVMSGLVELFNSGQTAAAIANADKLGVSQQMLMSQAAKRPGGETQVAFELRKLKEFQEKSKNININQFAVDADHLWQTIREIGTELNLIWTQAGIAGLPSFKRVADTIKDVLVWVRKFNETHPGAATIEAWGMAAAGVTALAGALALFTGKFILFNPYLIAFTGAAALITANWDSIVAWAETGGKRIIEAFEKGGWKAGWQEIGKQGAEALKWGWEKYTEFSTWIVPKLDAVTEAIKNFDFSGWGAAFGAALSRTLTAVSISPESADSAIKDPLLAALDRLAVAARDKAWAFIKSFASAAWQAIQEDPDIKFIKEWGETIFGWPGRMHEKLFGPAKSPEPMTPGQMYGGQKGDPFSTTVQGPGYQGGGIVSINAHEGEMVLPAPISRGLQALFKGGGGQGGDQGGQTYPAMRGLQRLGEWLTGLSGSIPRIMVTNWDDLIREQKEEKGFAGMTPQQLRDLGVPGYEGAGRGGGGGGGGGDVPQLGAPTAEDSQRLDLLEKTIYELETSSGKNVTTSSAGARGPMQITPDTWKDYAKPGENIDDPAANKAVGRRIIESLYKKYAGDLDKVLIAYNAGPGKVGASQLPAETQNYVKKAHAMWGAPNAVTPGVASSDVVQERQQGATRSQRITDQLRGILASAAKAVGVVAEVFSGGQPGEGAHRVGSHRHDFGRSADIKLKDPVTGRYLDMTNPEDQKRMEEFMRLSVRGGATGVGAAPGYMGRHGMHIGGGTPGYWGAGETKGGAPDWVRRAYEGGSPLSKQVDRMKDTTIGPNAAATQMNGNGDANKNVEMHVTNNVTINGNAEDPRAAEKRYRETNQRLHADLIRNLKPALA